MATTSYRCSRRVAVNSLKLRKFCTNIDLNQEMRKLTKQKSDPKQILNLFYKIKNDGGDYDDITYIIAQKALIQHHCQHKQFSNAKKVSNDLFNDKIYNKYLPKLSTIDYDNVIRIFLTNGDPITALEIFYKFVSSNLKTGPVIYTAAIQAAIRAKSCEHADKIYNVVMEKNSDLIKNDAQLCKSLMDMFLKCGQVNKAQQLFASMTDENKKSVGTWNILINGMILNNKANDALLLFDGMIKQSIKPDNITYVSVTKAISEIKSLDKANEIYEMIKNDANIDLYNEHNIILCNSVMSMFGKCGDPSTATEIFDYTFKNYPNQLDNRSWSAMLNIHYHHENYEHVMNLYDELLKFDHIQPDTKTFIIYLKTCIELDNFDKAKQIWKANELNERGFWIQRFMNSDIVNGIDLWRKVIEEYNVEEFAFIINLCIENKDNLKAFELFDEMQNKHKIKPNATLFRIMIKACYKNEILLKEMHKAIIDAGLECYNDKKLVHSLTDAYRKCGKNDLAQQVWKVYTESKQGKNSS